MRLGEQSRFRPLGTKIKELRPIAFVCRNLNTRRAKAL